jgi:hypothetical protein
MPSGENAWNQLLSGKRRRSKGSLEELARQLWYDIAVANAGTRSAMERADAEEVRKWLHVKQQLSGVYLKVMLDSDMEERLRAIEQRFDDGKSYTTNGAHRNSSL